MAGRRFYGRSGEKGSKVCVSEEKKKTDSANPQTGPRLLLASGILKWLQCKTFHVHSITFPSQLGNLVPDKENCGNLRGFHDVPRGGQKIGDLICETELKVGTQMWFHMFWSPLGTCRTFPPEARNRGFGAQIREIVVSFGLFRGGSKKSETTFVNRRLIPFNRCGLSFSGPPSERHPKTAAPPPSGNTLSPLGTLTPFVETGGWGRAGRLVGA